MRIAKNYKNLANLYRIAATIEQEIFKVKALKKEQEIEEFNTIIIILNNKILEVRDA